jgi:hypothetical protein
VLQGKPLTCEPIVKQFHPIRGDAGFSLQRRLQPAFSPTTESLRSFPRSVARGRCANNDQRAAALAGPRDALVGPPIWQNAKTPTVTHGAPLNLIGRRPTLPHTRACSTIGAEGLNFRVRDGNGWDPFARITQNWLKIPEPFAEPFYWLPATGSWLLL